MVPWIGLVPQLGDLERSIIVLRYQIVVVDLDVETLSLADAVLRPSPRALADPSVTGLALPWSQSSRRPRSASENACRARPAMRRLHSVPTAVRPLNRAG